MARRRLHGPALHSSVFLLFSLLPTSSAFLTPCRPALQSQHQLSHPAALSTPSPFCDRQHDGRLPLSLSATTMAHRAPGTANLDWANLGFEFRQTRSHIKFVWKNGEWSEGELVADPYVKVHIANTGLHYGQAIFEGLKAFAWQDGSIRIFRPQENAKRLRMSAERLLMTAFPEDKFVEAVRRVVADNADYVPPFGTGGSLYIRPLLFGSGPRIGLNPSDEYTLLIMPIPVGDYYKGGLSPVSALVIDDYDRAAPRGVGHVKVAGNYAADLLPNLLGKKKGYPIGLYLDAKTNSFVEEFSTSNFVAIDSSGAFVTPRSPTVLPSITNKSLMDLARDEGLAVQERAIPITEVKTLREVAACGTAVVVTPVNRVVYRDEVIKIGGEDGGTGPVTAKLYSRVRAIQQGEAEDKFSWTVKV
ncbi:branched-chain amino acid aminotransferase [Nannochloropsis gaditana]|uniref:Branched-chain amino acid aminotransferase n=1 Tax=Nannochloropsis gaditana TaxID=72520 RepID=W7TA87_9STRA|nr:branched-chain amino acid aminotransferase [Nannochloropsis gaditana]